MHQPWHHQLPVAVEICRKKLNHFFAFFQRHLNLLRQKKLLKNERALGDGSRNLFGNCSKIACLCNNFGSLSRSQSCTSVCSAATVASESKEICCCPVHSNLYCNIGLHHYSHVSLYNQRRKGGRSSHVRHEILQNFLKIRCQNYPPRSVLNFRLKILLIKSVPVCKYKNKCCCAPPFFLY